MITLKILTIIFVVFVGSRAVLRFKDRAIGYGEFLFWMLIWSSVLIITFYPRIADKTAILFGLQRGADAMFFIAIMILFYLIFRLYIKLDIIDRHLTRLNSNASQEIHKHHKNT